MTESTKVVSLDMYLVAMRAEMMDRVLVYLLVNLKDGLLDFH